MVVIILIVKSQNHNFFHIEFNQLLFKNVDIGFSIPFTVFFIYLWTSPRTKNTFSLNNYICLTFKLFNNVINQQFMNFSLRLTDIFSL